MTPETQAVLDRFHRALVAEIRSGHPEYLDVGFTVAEIYQNLVPYRSHRDVIGVEMNGDYEDALLRLLGGEGEYLVIESEPAREEIQAELASGNPNTGLYRDFAAVGVHLNPERVDDDDAELGGDALELELVADAEGDVESEALAEEIDQDAAPLSENGRSTLEEVADAAEAEAEAGSTDAQGATSTAACPKCSESLPDEESVRFCPFCGADVKLQPCVECGRLLEEDWRFCVGCGTAVEGR